MRWPASRCRPARWRWPRPSATCSRCWARCRALLESHGLAASRSCCASLAARTAARGPTSPRSASSARRPGRYNLHLGGDGRGQRLNLLYRENLDEATFLPLLDELIGAWARERAPAERFGDFLWRSGRLAAGTAP
jgi:sulfite reductase (NADPH) hemoprotein beta-component